MSLSGDPHPSPHSKIDNNFLRIYLTIIWNVSLIYKSGGILTESMLPWEWSLPSPPLKMISNYFRQEFKCWMVHLFTYRSLALSMMEPLWTWTNPWMRSWEWSSSTVDREGYSSQPSTLTSVPCKHYIILNSIFLCMVEKQGGLQTKIQTRSLKWCTCM